MSDIHSYEKIKEWKDKHIASSLSDNLQLNQLHDETMCKVVLLAIEKLEKGEPPCPYTWFITGSGGRLEQGTVSDQDHGLIYQTSNKEYDRYFSELGKEISYGLHAVGYPYCQGNVMSSNSIWCKSLEEWREQILVWLEEASWETIRNLQIFYDARTLLGKDSMIRELKERIYLYQKENPRLLMRFMKNIMHIKNGIGPLGQFVVEEHGSHVGAINLKYTAFLPYVNAVRLLAIKEGIYETSTIDRMNKLILISDYEQILDESKKLFILLLKYRSLFYGVESYDDSHYLQIKNLTRAERAEVKQILKGGKMLHHYVHKLILG